MEIERINIYIWIYFEAGIINWYNNLFMPGFTKSVHNASWTDLTINLFFIEVFKVSHWHNGLISIFIIIGS